MSALPLPVGYVSARERGNEAFAWAAAADWVRSRLVSGDTVHGWATASAERLLAGRGPVPVVRAPAAGPDGRDRWAVRHYRRGGAVARVLGDRYFRIGVVRPLRELRVSVLARERGIPTPAVVAGVVYGRAPGYAWYRADLVTELLPAVRTLAEAVRSAPADAACEPLSSAGGLVARLRAAGVLHADLNATNVLLDDGNRAWVVDLDRCSLRRSLGRRHGLAMLARLERSLSKGAGALGRALTPAERDALRAGYEAAA